MSAYKSEHEILERFRHAVVKCLDGNQPEIWKRVKDGEHHLIRAAANTFITEMFEHKHAFVIIHNQENHRSMNYTIAHFMINRTEGIGIRINKLGIGPVVTANLNSPSISSFGVNDDFDVEYFNGTVP